MKQEAPTSVSRSSSRNRWVQYLTIDVSNGDIEESDKEGLLRAENIAGEIVAMLTNKEFVPKELEKEETDEDQWICPECNSKNASVSKFCTNCGKARANKAKFCGACGEKLPDGVKFCPSCGAKACD